MHLINSTEKVLQCIGIHDDQEVRAWESEMGLERVGESGVGNKLWIVGQCFAFQTRDATLTFLQYATIANDDLLQRLAINMELFRNGFNGIEARHDDAEGHVTTI